MANNTIRRSWNMFSMVNIEDLRGSAFQAEDGGHTFEITGLDANGNATAISGTVAAVFMRPDNTDVAITGSVSNGKAYVTLTDECYGYPGRFGLTIFLTSGGQKVAIYAAIGSVYRTTSGSVSPETAADVVDLINEIEAAIAQIPASYTDIMAGVAPTYSNTAVYPVGAYAWYEGVLYRCIVPITTGESWTSSHWTSASIASDVTKNSINKLGYVKTLAANSDLNDLYVPGWYVLSANSAYLHTPEPDGTTGQRVVIVYPGEDTATSSAYRLMTYVNIGTGVSARRLFTNNAWLNWTNEFCFNSNPSKDLNDFYQNGWYVISASESALLHSPEADGTTGQRQVYVFSYNQTTTNTYRVMFYTNQATGIVAMRSYWSSAWHEWQNLTGYNGELSDGSDLNSLYQNGWYTSAYAAGISNSPEPAGTIGQRIVGVFASSGKPTSNTQRYMFYLNKATGIAATRIFNSGSWGAWSIQYSRILDLANGDDLNSLYQNGWYTTGYSHNYTNSPESSGTIGRRLIWINSSSNNPTSNSFRWMHYINLDTGVTAKRVFANGAWESWIRDGENERTRSESFSGSAQASQGENTGDNIRLMTYNVARYNNNSETYIPDAKLFNLRKIVGKINADIICTQEDMGTIDGSSKSSHDYVYKPQYPYMYNNGAYANLIYSKKQASTSGRVKFTQYGSQYRGIEYAVFEIGSKKLLVCTSHPSWNDTGTGGESAESIAVRLAQYTEMFNWLSGSATMKDYTTDNNVSVPTHTHCIIGMDANCDTSTDKTNLASAASAKNFILGNGGALGWFITNPSGNSSIDEVIVSDNIIINNIESYGDWFKQLYSDHVPVVADVTLL